MPRAPKHCGRQGCRELVTARTYCDAHAREQRNASSWGRGSTRQSRRDRAEVLRRWPTCHLQYDDGCTHISTEDDHVIPRSQGGTNDLTNRRGACTHCHRIKSQREAATARATSAGAGTPSPHH